MDAFFTSNRRRRDYLLAVHSSAKLSCSLRKLRLLCDKQPLIVSQGDDRERRGTGVPESSKGRMEIARGSAA